MQPRRCLSDRPLSCGPGPSATCVEPLEHRILLTTVIVNTTTDAPHSAQLLSLRDAVSRANASSQATTITFDPKVFAAPKTILLDGDVLVLSNQAHPITIVGPVSALTVSGGQNQADFNDFEERSGVVASISRLTVTKGGIYNQGTMSLNNVIVSAATVTTAGNGGGIANDGTMTISGVTISGNAVSSGLGGGLYNTGTATISNSIIKNNSASGYGGGIYSSGTLVVTNVSVVGNSSGYSSDVGGVDNTGRATLIDVAIYNNIGTGFANHGGNARLENVTISGNHAAQFGGGVVGRDGILSLYDDTISANTAVDDGGGIQLQTSSTAVLIANTVVAGNSAGGAGPEVYGAVSSLGNNLIGKADGSSGWLKSDDTGSASRPLDPRLGLLVSNGGSTPTMLPLPNSPLIDRGSNALIPKGITTDERGAARVANSTVDIGAVEVQPAAVLLLPVVGAIEGFEPQFSVSGVDPVGGNLVFEIEIRGDGFDKTFVTKSVKSGSNALLTLKVEDGIPCGAATWRARSENSANIYGSWSQERAITFGAGIDAVPSPTTAQWQVIKNSGAGYYLTSASPSFAPLGKLHTARVTEGLKIASYLFVNLTKVSSLTSQQNILYGQQRMDQAIGALGSEFSHLSFLAIDVEIDGVVNVKGNLISPVSAVERIQAEVDELVQYNKLHGTHVRPFIYTRIDYWNVITNYSSQFSSLPLWETTDGATQNADLNADFKSFGGWKGRAGKQYAIDDPNFGMAKVDLNVFDPSAFT